ncbi:MAG TPA: ArsR family transcriptional regulator [Candidatus Acidoferrum sp.]|nr:ArsR family transcriptional regulator [Candidatus Acidoferrum sp.]
MLQSTRGRVLALIQTDDRTVNELVDELGLTDNAVRAHLIGLQRDGLVRPTGREAGVRRPHVVYGLTPEAEHIFPKAYGPLLNEFVTVIAQRLGPRALRASMRQVGRRIARQKRKSKKQSKAGRIKAALIVLKEMGGAASFSVTGGKNLIQGNGCPLSALTADHPEGCLIAESLLSEIIGAQVKERCIRGLQPSCRFEIS